jgi:hypothetical protein
MYARWVLPLPGLSMATGVSSACSTLQWRAALPKGIHQRLQLHPALAHPLRQRRARDRQTRALEDAFLPVQRQVIEELGHQHLGQQATGGDALVDDLRGDRRLHQRLAGRADPLAADVALDVNTPGL